MRFTFKNSAIVLAFALTLIRPGVAQAQSAGAAQFTTGDVRIIDAKGVSEQLVAGTIVNSGQTIATGASGHVQLRFSDGGLVSLQPNSEFRIANYADRSDPREDRFFVELLRGGMRAITGLIGKRDHSNYRVTAKTATIGIRGSAFRAVYNTDGSLSVTTELDAIELCNAGTCIGLTAGESAIVRGENEQPIRTFVRATIALPEPMQGPLVIGNQVNSSGGALVLPTASPPFVAPPTAPVPTTPPVTAPPPTTLPPCSPVC